MAREHYLWVEKYRPQTIDECILPERYKKTFKQFISQGEIPHLLLTGGPGVGKTTAAKAMCREMGVDVLVINASESGNIDTLRTTIRQFASTKSLSGKGKVVILDEADYLNPNSTQPALRNFMEEFSKNCRFILTANFPNRIIEPLRSRLSIVEFRFATQEKQSLAGQFMKRVENILDTEGVEYVKPALAQVIVRYFPDYRKVLNELQKHASEGKIDGAIVSRLSDESVTGLIKHLKKKEFTETRKWVAEHLDYDFSQILKELKGPLFDAVTDESKPQLVLTLYQYDRDAAMSTDRELHMTACFTEIMVETEFK